MKLKKYLNEMNQQLFLTMKVILTNARHEILNKNSEKQNHHYSPFTNFEAECKFVEIYREKRMKLKKLKEKNIIIL